MLKLSTKKFIEKAATNLRTASGQADSINVDLKLLASSANIKLISANLGEISGMSFLEDGERFVAYNKTETNTNRRRFTISHEIGHIVLHHNLLVSVSDNTGVLLRNSNSSKGTDAKEVEANYFAACLLMPKSLLQEKISELDVGYISENEIEVLSEDFKVSPTAMTFRLTYLGYL